MKMQIRSVFFFYVCSAPLDLHAILTRHASEPIRECSASPSNTQGHWSWRLIDGRKCWYAGKTVISKSLLRWPAAALAQAKADAAPVSVVAEKRSGPMDAQARMLDADNTFEARWRARVSSE